MPFFQKHPSPPCGGGVLIVEEMRNRVVEGQSLNIGPRWISIKETKWIFLCSLRIRLPLFQPRASSQFATVCAEFLRNEAGPRSRHVDPNTFSPSGLQLQRSFLFFSKRAHFFFFSKYKFRTEFINGVLPTLVYSQWRDNLWLISREFRW